VTVARPAFYALERGGWRDYVTLLHPPYTLWHLSYVVIGAAIAPEWHPGRLAAALGAFFLAVGVGAHALDELQGRPLGTLIPRRVLLALAAGSIVGAAAIGVALAVAFDLWLIAFVACGAFIVCAYNLELFGGRLHNELSFGLFWGAFPLLTAYFAGGGTIRWAGVLAALFAALLSLAQRRLSSEVRYVRRRTAAVVGTIELADGGVEQLTAERLLRGPEAALRVLAAAAVALAVALVLVRVSA
jgi:hypothetical protein